MPEESAHRFSIVVPAYNAETTLAETLEAVLAQRMPEFECVVVDDGSTDGTFELAKRFAARDPRIHAIHQSNTGASGAYNTGINAARGDHIVLCSADDVLLPEHLATFSAFMGQHPGYDIYSSNGYMWHPGESKALIYYDQRSRKAHSRSFSDVIRVCFYSAGAVFRRELFDRTGGFRVGVFGEDYDFWLRSMALGARHMYLPEPLSLFRISPGQKSANHEAMYRSDIRLVSELRDTYPLSDEELRAVADCIAERERLIAGLHGGSLHALRARLEPLAIRLVGRPRARKAWQVMKTVARTTTRR